MRSALETAITDTAHLPQGLRDIFTVTGVILAIAGLSLALAGHGLAACVCFLTLITLALVLWLMDVHTALLAAQDTLKGLSDMATTVADLKAKIGTISSKVDTTLTAAQALYNTELTKVEDLEKQLADAQAGEQDLSPLDDDLTALEQKVDDALAQIPSSAPPADPPKITPSF